MALDGNKRMTESDFLESIKNLSETYKRKNVGKNSLSWAKYTYRALYSINSGMAADSLWMSRKKVDIKKSSVDGEWKDDHVSVEISKTFFRLYLEKYKNLDDTSGEKAENILKVINARFSAANEKTFKILEDFIASGYMESLAKVLIYLPKERRKSAIQKLPEEVQEKISALLDSYSQKKNCDADVLSAAGFVLKNAGFYGGKAASEVIGGQDALFMSAMQENAASLFEQNPLLSLNLEHFLVSMEILTQIDDRSVQKWLREVDQTELAKAMKGASQEVQGKVFRNMSRRASAMLQEDMEFMGPVRKSDVLESQNKLIKILKELNDRGDIVIPHGAAG